ncbi:MAG: diphosphate--fructose-6-phosphate 1-phosphotransferase [Thermodesulfovibrionales bacterium]|nr:diphosphate--fructose-6-phosphate 1-phosphotransferase [Thermodesulfovibrionales bacterium]
MRKGKGYLGIVVGGGPAPGINGVISSATIEAINEGCEVIGIKGGFKTLFNGDKKSVVKLTINDVSRIHTQGGSILGTSRDYPDRVKERFRILIRTLRDLGIRYLITIGGEGTVFMANWIQKEAKWLSVAHVPKTIDNDIPLPGGMPTFGYETARHWGVEIVKNIMEDARTMERWYFVTTMGRHAGHLALGIGKSSGATITLIPEEFREKVVPLKKISDLLAGSIIKRLAMGRTHGVAILAEGIAEKLDINELSKYEYLEKDETGRIRLSEIQLGRILKHEVKNTLKEHGINITIVDKNIGYELRAAAPIPFDVEYTRNLGYGAVKFLLEGGRGALVSFHDGKLHPVPFEELTNKEGRISLRLVDINSETYMVGRMYMIRLESGDFKGEMLKKLSGVCGISPEEFRKRFIYLTEDFSCRPVCL